MNANLQDSDYHFARISDKWNEAVQSILDTAAYVSDARKELNSYQFQQLWERPDAPFSLKTADKLDAIAQNNLLPTIQDKLPPYWTTIYYIASQDEGDVQRAIDAQVKNSECSQKEIEQFCQQVLMNTLGPVTLLTSFEEEFYFWEKLLIPSLSVGLTLIPSRLAGPKAIEPTPGDLKEPT